MRKRHGTNGETTVSKVNPNAAKNADILQRIRASYDEDYDHPPTMTNLEFLLRARIFLSEDV